MYNETRSGAVASLQVAQMGSIDLTGGDFKLHEERSFQIKNDGTTSIELEVKLAGMHPTDEWVRTKFDCGWNPEIIREIKQANLPGTNLKWGY